MDAVEVSLILNDLQYKDWTFEYRESFGTDTQIRVSFFDAEEGQQHGRWWVISQHATRSEVVSTALLAVLQAEEHEARERFRYQGVKVFNPHVNVNLLQMLRFSENLDVRPEPAAV